MQEMVILVDENDNVIGSMEKMEAHEKGLLHRAFSIFVFNKNKELMLQKRAIDKYHSGGLWTNTCCSHPRFNETILEAANRRLKEEMGFTCHLEREFSFIYYKKLDKGLIEHELDHVIFGEYNFSPQINHTEVSDYKFISIPELIKDVKSNPQLYTEWFKICLPKVIQQALKIAA
jgi:isopentenyl-diphosphate delta-isomerase